MDNLMRIVAVIEVPLYEMIIRAAGIALCIFGLVYGVAQRIKEKRSKRRKRNERRQ